MLVCHIDHINVVVSDLDTAGHFFERLGFVIDRQRELSGKWIDQVVGLDGVFARYLSLSLPGQSRPRLELLEYVAPPARTDEGAGLPNQLGIRHLAFQVEDIDGVYSRLLAEGIGFFSQIQVNPYGKKMCYFYGPDNIILELSQA